MSCLADGHSPFQHHRRVKVGSLGIEANYYPITASAFIQDNDVRLTLLTNHAQGVAGFEPGRAFGPSNCHFTEKKIWVWGLASSEKEWITNSTTSKHEYSWNI